MAQKIKKVPKFKFKHLPDSYDHIFTDKKSHYAEDMKEMVLIECTYPFGFKDMEMGVMRTKGERWYTNKVRAYELASNPKNIVRIVEEAKQ